MTVTVFILSEKLYQIFSLDGDKLMKSFKILDMNILICKSIWCIIYVIYVIYNRLYIIIYNIYVCVIHPVKLGKWYAL